MSQEKISNELIYELLKDFKADTKRRFEEAKAEQVELKQSIKQIDIRLASVETKLNSHQIVWTAKIIAGILATNALISTLIFWLLSRLASGGFRIVEAGKEFFIS